MTADMLLVIFWALCAIAGLLLAPHRRRTPVEGFLLGALLGPLGLAVILLWPGKAEVSQPASSE